MSHAEHHVREYPLQQGALEIAYIEELFNEFPKRKTAADIELRLSGREMQILMAEAALPEDPSVMVPVSYKVSHELHANDADAGVADLVDRLKDVVAFDGRRVLYSWLGATRRDWRGQGHYRAVTEAQEQWALEAGFDEIVIKTRNRYYDMRGALARMQYDAIKVEASRSGDPMDAKLYLSKRIGPSVLDAHRNRPRVKTHE